MVTRSTSAKSAWAKSTWAMRRRSRSAVVLLAAMAALTALSTDASAAKKARPAQPAEATADRVAGEPIMAIVSIKSQQVTWYDSEAGSTARRFPPA